MPKLTVPLTDTQIYVIRHVAKLWGVTPQEVGRILLSGFVDSVINGLTDPGTAAEFEKLPHLRVNPEQP